MATFKEELESVELLHHLQAMITYKAWSDYLFFSFQCWFFSFFESPTGKLPAHSTLSPDSRLDLRGGDVFRDYFNH